MTETIYPKLRSTHLYRRGPVFEYSVNLDTRFSHSKNFVQKQDYEFLTREGKLEEIARIIYFPWLKYDPKWQVNRFST